MISHIRIDAEGNPTDDDFKALASSCDLLIIPAVPESVRPEKVGTKRLGSRMPEACRRRNLSRCPPG
jgi:hypothetical protein